jgi:hypothetical protein
MTRAASGARLPWITIGNLVRLALVIITIVAVSSLFVQAWRPPADRADRAEREKHGVEYIATLTEVARTLSDAQSAAVSGQTVSRDALNRATDAVGKTDERLGKELRTEGRWADLRAKIEALPDRALATPSATYAAYTEVSGLLLALYDDVREHSFIERDPDTVTYYLQDAATDELPQVIVMAGRYADLTTLATLAAARPAASSDSGASAPSTGAPSTGATAGAPTGAQAASGDPAAAAITPEQAAALAQAQAAETYAAVATNRASVAESAGDLSHDLQAAVDETSSGTLGTNILAQLDRFQRSVDILAPSTGGLAAGKLAPMAVVAKQRAETQAAASNLSRAILRELSTLLDQRMDDSSGSERVALGTLILSALLLIGTVVAVWFGARNRDERSDEARDIPRSGPPAGPGGPGGGHRVSAPGGFGAGPGVRPGGGRGDPVLAGFDGRPTGAASPRGEASGVPR